MDIIRNETTVILKFDFVITHSELKPVCGANSPRIALSGPYTGKSYCFTEEENIVEYIL